MSGLIAALRGKGVDLQPYRMIGIERIESFNEKRKVLFNPAIINSFKPFVQELFTTVSLRAQLDGFTSFSKQEDGSLESERLLELFYRPQYDISPVDFYNSCDAISLIELTLLQLSDALINARKEQSTDFFFKVESRILYALDEALIYFSTKFSTYGINLYIEISHRPFISNDTPISTLIRLHEHGVNLVIDNYAWRGGDWRERYISSGIFCCVKFDTPPLLQNEINSFKDSMSLLLEKYNFKTIVGKVETKRQSEIVFSTGCWAVQGFYYSRPRTVKLMDLHSL
ncbi:EAL domain-containing protein [Aeromonas sp. MdU4]|uniref:EAL domain-containing protein n=1 Tax=Aeromonas sp. MdU4 TaxID=3342819 RepID=UPI0035BAD994